MSNSTVMVKGTYLNALNNTLNRLASAKSDDVASNVRAAYFMNKFKKATKDVFTQQAEILQTSWNNAKEFLVNFVKTNNIDFDLAKLDSPQHGNDIDALIKSHPELQKMNDEIGVQQTKALGELTDKEYQLPSLGMDLVEKFNTLSVGDIELLIDSGIVVETPAS